MNIQAIQMVVCVAEEQSFSRAAEKLFVSQPAISKQIQQMERELGVALFKRDRHQVELTPAGAACLPLFQQMKRDYERVQRIARRFDTDVQGSVGIAYPNVTTLSLMSQTLSALREKFPLLHAQPVKMPALQLLQSLDDGTVSMAIVFHEMIRNRTDLAYVLLRRGRMSALVPKTHELASRPYLDYATLRSYSLILHEMSANQLEMTGMLAELSAHGIDYHTCRREKRARYDACHQGDCAADRAAPRAPKIKKIKNPPPQRNAIPMRRRFFYTCANQKVTLPKPTLFPLALSNSAMLSPTIFSGSSVSTA